MNFCIEWARAMGRERLVLLLICFFLSGKLAPLQGAEEQQPFGIDHRIPWTTSRVFGSPDPPLPYTIEKIFTNLTWKEPVFITPEPDSKRFLVVLAGGEKERPSKILSIPDDPAADKFETFLEVPGWLVYSLTFHP